jgi:hypothetical protein
MIVSRIVGLGLSNGIVELASLDKYTVKYGNIALTPHEAPVCGCNKSN